MDAATKPDQQDIQRALIGGARAYFDDCRQRIPGFIDHHFHYPGAWQTNRAAIGFDLLRAPFNLIWAPIYACICLLKFAFRKPGWGRSYQLLDAVPSGLTTRVQRRIGDLIYTDLLHCSDRKSPLEDHILRQLQAVYAHSHPDETFDPRKLQRQLQPLVKDAVEQYSITRTASADITSTMACTVLGAFAFQKFTPGGIGIGVFMAALWAKNHAVGNFLFGKTLGDVYYGLFPPEPAPLMTAASVALVLVILATFASFAGLIADPLQAALGIHRRRLRKMIDHLEQDFTNKALGSFRPRDQYIARILDAFDMIRAHLA